MMRNLQETDPSVLIEAIKDMLPWIQSLGVAVESDQSVGGICGAVARALLVRSGKNSEILAREIGWNVSTLARFFEKGYLSMPPHGHSNVFNDSDGRYEQLANALCPQVQEKEQFLKFIAILYPYSRQRKAPKATEKKEQKVVIVSESNAVHDLIMGVLEARISENSLEGVSARKLRRHFSCIISRVGVSVGGDESLLDRLKSVYIETPLTDLILLTDEEKEMVDLLITDIASKLKSHLKGVPASL